MAGIIFSRHKSPAFECPNGMGDVTGIEHGCMAEFGLTQLPLGGQRRYAAILVSVDPSSRKVLV